jgi:general L-amino acid transport system permease protein
MHRIALPLPDDGLPMSDRQIARIRYLTRQGLIIAAVIGVIAWVALATRAGLARHGIGFHMSFLSQPAGFDISEGVIPTLDGWRQFTSSDTNASALVVGFVNTLKASVVAIVIATVLGVLLGIARVSRNWLVRQLTFAFVEFVRNTPLMIQLVFWYFAVVLKMPALSEATGGLGAIFSQQGIYLPGLAGAPNASHASVWALLITIVFSVSALTRKPGRYRMLGLAALGLSGCAVLGFPITVTTPSFDGSVVNGGISVSPELGALLIALGVYTGAFIAEIVRGAILSLHKGQWEAAAALGLNRRVTFIDVVIPQVFRVVLPSFGNQYIGLIKTTSLGIAIGFPDLFNVYGTVANQSGRSLEGMLIVMAAYLVLSWGVSGATNYANGRLLRAGGNR